MATAAASPSAAHEWNLPSELDFDGRKVRWGRFGTGPPLVLVHGTPWSSYNLRHLARGLDSSFTVYCYDLIGYGLSSKEDGDVSLGVQNRLLAALFAHWRIDSPVVIAHDFGGTTALRAHILDGIRYAKLVLIDPVALSPWGSPFFKHVNQHEQAFAGVPDFIHHAIVKAYVETAAYQSIPSHVLANILKPWEGDDGKAAFYRQIAQACSKYTDEVQDRYGSISIPVLVLWGEEDTWIPVEKAYELQQRIPLSQLSVIPDAGHLVIEEKPERLLDEIRRFLQL